MWNHDYNPWLISNNPFAVVLNDHWIPLIIEDHSLIIEVESGKFRPETNTFEICENIAVEAKTFYFVKMYRSETEVRFCHTISEVWDSLGQTHGQTRSYPLLSGEQKLNFSSRFLLKTYMRNLQFLNWIQFFFLYFKIQKSNLRCWKHDFRASRGTKISKISRYARLYAVSVFFLKPILMYVKSNNPNYAYEIFILFWKILLVEPLTEVGTNQWHVLFKFKWKYDLLSSLSADKPYRSQDGKVEIFW